MKTALTVVDMQNAFCHPEGSFRKRGYQIINLESVIKTNKKLIDFAHSNNWLVVYTKLVFKSNYSNAGLLLEKHPEIKQLKAYIENSFDSEIFRDLYPNDRDLILNKTRYDPFIKTNLEEILRQNQVDNCIVSGLLTNVCVESTVRSAFDRDFKITLVSDATSTYSEELYKASLETMKKHFAEVYSYEKLMDIATTLKL